jgi:amino acid permease
MKKKFSPFEIVIAFLAIIIIFISEYYYTILKDHDRAIFIGLWPPTMLILLIYLNSKKD